MQNPVYNKNIYSTEALLDSNKVFKELRDLGDVVYLPKHKMYAVTRFDGVRKALQANDVLISGKGITANKIVNKKAGNTTLMSDGETHKRMRGVLMKPLARPQMKHLKDQITSSADECVRNLLKRDSFEAVQEFAAHLPLTVVSKMVGLPEEGRANMLKWAAAGFNAIGPLNWRALKGLPTMIFGFERYVDSLSVEKVHPGGWAAKVFEAVNNGTLSLEEGKGMVLDYVGPSLDTTILAASYMFWQMGNHPTAFSEIKANPDLIPGVINEVVRLSSPIRGFGRYAVEDFDINGSVIPKDSRVFIYYASANRDERHYENADTFDIHRNPKDQVGWGHGSHGCVGSHLARLELEELLKALARNVNTIKAKNPTFICNNILQGYMTIEGRVK